MKNIDFTDFFNVFLSGATIRHGPFSMRPTGAFLRRAAVCQAAGGVARRATGLSAALLAGPGHTADAQQRRHSINAHARVKGLG